MEQRFELKELPVEKGMTNIEDINLSLVDFNTIAFRHHKASSKGTKANLMIEGKLVNIEVVTTESISTADLLEMVKEHLHQTFVEKRIEDEEECIEEVNLDNVNEELLESASPMKGSISQSELLHRNGFVRGAIVKRQIDYEYDYGIFTGEFYDSEGDTIGLRFTDGKSFHQDYCILVDDVNKQIIRTVEAEKGRIIHEANEFCDLISLKINEIIYGG